LFRSPNPEPVRFEVDGNRAYGVGFTDGPIERVVDRLLRNHPDVDTAGCSIDMPGTRDVTL